MTLQLSNLSGDVKESLLKLQDYIEITPLFGRRRVIRLNRTTLQFVLKKQGDMSVDPTLINLPGIDAQKSLYSLDLIDGNYVLSHHEGVVFKLNGQLCLKAFLSDQDELFIGHNRLKFIKQELRQTDNEEVHSLFKTDLNILIEGETGVGKSYLAKKMHDFQERSGEFVHLNLSSFPIGLIESEIFGHAKGAFTGAIKDKVGAIEQAKFGTLFLDEIDSLPLEIQVKLLLFLDNKIIRPVGATREVKCETAIIFASGRCLKDLVSKKLMRKDLFFRIISGHKVTLRPLREDRQKIESICDNFALENNIRITVELKKFLVRQSWPGNIRQLQGHLQKKMVLSKTRILDLNQVDDELLDFDITNEKQGSVIPFKDVKSRYFLRAFQLSNEDYNVAAKRMGVSYNTVKREITNQLG